MYIAAKSGYGLWPLTSEAKPEAGPEELPRRLKVLNSWKRSMAFGVDPYKPADNLIVPADELQEIIGRNQALIDHARPEMEQLLEILEEEDPCVVLNDADGVLVASVNVENNPIFRDNPGCALGSKWGESVAGTNAISLALDEKEACFLTSREHFVQDGYSWTCFACPIFNLKGEVTGVLSLVYGSEVEANAEVMALVMNSSRTVELNLNRAEYRPLDALDRLARDLSVLIFDAFMIIDEGRRAHFLNPAAAEFFSLPTAAGYGQDLAELVPLRNIHFWELLRRGEEASGKCLHLSFGHNPNGRGRKVRVNFMPMREVDQPPKDNDGRRPRTMVIVFRPLEERGRTRAAMADSRARLEFRKLVGRHPAFLRAVAEAELVAKSEANVVLTGESGVGKDLFAQCIHQASDRRSGPYYALNCASIPRELIASELFGYEEGAFTGARKGGRPGKLELAHGGTLLLDEIGEMSFDLQAYLLRAIESRDIMRLGGERVMLVDTRIVCATNRNLDKAIAEGSFRADLFYRLAVVTIGLPPLRERREDIPLLVEAQLAASGDLTGRKSHCTPEFLDRLMSYDYPGNIRELKNAVERALILSNGGQLEAEFLPPVFYNGAAECSRPASGAMADVESKLIRDTLKRFRYNKSQTAAFLGISRNSLYHKIKLYGLG